MFWFDPAVARNTEEIKSEIYAQMHERHPKPDAEFWAGLGTESVPVLKEMYRASTSPIEKAWVIEGLSHFSDSSISEVLKEDIKTSDNAVFKKKMISALIQSQGDSVFDFVEPYLSDKDPHIRLAVAIGMQRQMAGDAVQKRLAKFKADESLSWVKDDLKRETEIAPVLMKRSGSAIDARRETDQPKALNENDWAGDWNGVYVSQSKPKIGILTLSREKGKEKSWKAELKFKKMSKYELKREGIEIVYSQSAHLHWIEVRNKKEDAVFIGSRKQP